MRAFRRQGGVHGDATDDVGYIAVVTFATHSAETATRWVEALINAAAHFHVRVDGQRLINYAEWIDAEAHQRTTGQDRQRRPAAAEVVDRTEGVRFLSVRRYPYWRGVHP